MPIWASSGRAACDAARYLRPRPHQRRDAGLFDRTLPRRARGRLGRLRRAAHPAREEGRPRAVERRAAAASLALSRDALLAVYRARDQPRQGAAPPSRGAVEARLFPPLWRAPVPPRPPLPVPFPPPATRGRRAGEGTPG